MHQCAQYGQNPKLSHEKAVKRIIRYLRRTRDKGLILIVNEDLGLECYMDANFAGTFDKNKPDNPRDCLSRTGYIIKYAGCPIIWASKMQTTIAMSTTEAEYMALSTAMREVIYCIHLLDELTKKGIRLSRSTPVVKCSVFEDNVGAIELAKMPKWRPRTKHIAIQYHHFREWTVAKPDGTPPWVTVQHISTIFQEADIMTKPLPKAQFEALCKALCGW